MMKFLKGCLNLVLLTIAVIVAAVILSVKEFGRQNRLQKIDASLTIKPSGEWRHPLVVTIRNNSEESLISTRWRLAAFEKNRSTQILNSNLYVSDFIIRAGGARRFRCDVPNAQADVEVVNRPISDYRWEVVMIDAQFSADHMPVGGEENVEKVQNSGKSARIRCEPVDGGGTVVEPRLLGMQSIRFNIESSDWKNKKGASFLSKLLNPDSRNEDPIRPFEVRLGVTNNSNARLNILRALRFDLHGRNGGDVYHLDQLDGMASGPDAAADFILEPREARALTLAYKVNARSTPLDENAWSLRLTERVGGDHHHIIILKGEGKD